MTVEELIEKLKDMPKDSTVNIVTSTIVKEVDTVELSWGFDVNIR